MAETRHTEAKLVNNLPIDTIEKSISENASAIEKKVRLLQEYLELLHEEAKKSQLSEGLNKLTWPKVLEVNLDGIITALEKKSEKGQLEEKILKKEAAQNSTLTNIRDLEASLKKANARVEALQSALDLLEENNPNFASKLNGVMELDVSKFKAQLDQLKEKEDEISKEISKLEIEGLIGEEVASKEEKIQELQKNITKKKELLALPVKLQKLKQQLERYNDLTVYVADLNEKLVAFRDAQKKNLKQEELTILQQNIQEFLKEINEIHKNAISKRDLELPGEKDAFNYVLHEDFQKTYGNLVLEIETIEILLKGNNLTQIEEDVTKLEAAKKTIDDFQDKITFTIGFSDFYKPKEVLKSKIETELKKEESNIQTIKKEINSKKEKEVALKKEIQELKDTLGNTKKSESVEKITKLVENIQGLKTEIKSLESTQKESYKVLFKKKFEENLNIKKLNKKIEKFKKHVEKVDDEDVKNIGNNCISQHNILMESTINELAKLRAESDCKKFKEKGVFEEELNLRLKESQNDLNDIWNLNFGKENDETTFSYDRANTAITTHRNFYAQMGAIGKSVTCVAAVLAGITVVGLPISAVIAWKAYKATYGSTATEAKKDEVANHGKSAFTLFKEIAAVTSENKSKEEEASSSPSSSINPTAAG